jgi:transposase
MSNDTTIGVDLAKSVFEVAVSQEVGRVSSRRRLSRSKFLPYFQQQAPATVVMEACGSAHHWARTLEKMAHTVVLLPPSQVRPYVVRNKTDQCDARALLEAYRNESIMPVPVKSIDTQVLASLHRFREGWMHRRTALLNSIRGSLRELGVFIPEGARLVLPKLAELLEEPSSPLPVILRPALRRAIEEVKALEGSVRELEAQLEAVSAQNPQVQRLRTVPGIGLLTATALVAFVGDLGRFPSGRRLAAYLGLTPREHSSGNRRRLGGISKRGNTYVRTFLIHGARSSLRYAREKKGPQGRLQVWARSVADRRGYNIAAVALANKMARLAWAVCREEKTFSELNCAVETTEATETTA